VSEIPKRVQEQALPVSLGMIEDGVLSLEIAAIMCLDSGTDT